MASVSTPSRRALGDLDANTPLKRRAGDSSYAAGPAKASNSPAKPRTLGEASLHTLPAPTAVLKGLDAEGRVLGTKRHRDAENVAVEDEAGPEEPGEKRHKVSHVPWQGGQAHRSVDQIGRSLSPVHRSSPGAGQQHTVEYCPVYRTYPSSPASAASPASSLESSDSRLNDSINDSQNTTMTIPDEDHLLPQRPIPLTHEQLRQKARDIRLRLSLASYKVRTNQIDIPISRLEIRTSGASMSTSTSTSTSSRPLSFTQSTIPTPESQTQGQAPRPSSASTIPKSNLQVPSAGTGEKRPRPATVLSLPPLRHPTQEASPKQSSPQKSTATASQEVTAASLLARQRESLLKPPALDTPACLGDQARSAVQDSAADGLLSLLNQNKK